MTRSWTKKKLFFFCAVLSAACTPSFASPSDVTDLRVLAVQAEPPEAQYDASSADPVHIRILAVDPVRSGAFALMKWDLCAPTDSRRCLSGPIVPQASGSQTRHGGTEFSADIFVPAQLVQALVGNDKLGGFGGMFRAQFSFLVDDGDPNPAYADKTLVYSPRGPAPNHNPLLTGLALTRNGAPAGSVALGETLSLPLGVEIGIRPLLAADAREEYDTTDLQGKTVHLKEQPAYAFFTTAGAEFDRDTADEPIDGVAPPDGLTRIDALRAGQGTMWVVVRDGRGGESWITVPWSTP